MRFVVIDDMVSCDGRLTQTIFPYALLNIAAFLSAERKADRSLLLRKRTAGNGEIASLKMLHLIFCHEMLHLWLLGNQQQSGSISVKAMTRVVGVPLSAALVIAHDRIGEGAARLP